MSRNPRSLIHLKNLEKSEIEGLFARAKEFSQIYLRQKKSSDSLIEICKENLKSNSPKESVENVSLEILGEPKVSPNLFPLRGETLALVFFENSTRTRMSFETAAVRMGFYPQLLDCNSGSSLEKGETKEDTLLNIGALGPRLVVVRCGDEVDLTTISKLLPCPIINAGWGMKGHPTQGLLDIFTIQQHRQSLQDLRLLIVGDVYHSRVASSHFQLADKLGFAVAVAGPSHFMPKDREVKRFTNLEEGLRWANVVMALRVQMERHEQKGSSENISFENYNKTFGLNSNSLRNLSQDGLILHPGPINWGIELHEDVQMDSRQVILEQVKNGVFVRQAVIDFCLKY